VPDARVAANGINLPHALTPHVFIWGILRIANMRTELTSSDLMRQTLKGHIDHEGVQTLLESAAACDEAQQCLADGDYEAALQIALPLVLLQSPVVANRAKETAIAALDELMEQALDARQPRRALRYLDQWLSLEPKGFFPLIRRAEILQHEIGDLHEAWTAYLQVLRHYPHSIEAFLGLAQLALAEGNPERAYPYILRAWQSLANSEWAYTPSVRTMQAVFEDLYDITAGMLQWLGSAEEARALTQKAIALLGETEILKERMQIIEELGD
jgi:tetratricopeptide (TPR) repeat protein